MPIQSHELIAMVDETPLKQYDYEIDGWDVSVEKESGSALVSAKKDHILVCVAQYIRGDGFYASIGHEECDPVETYETDTASEAYDRFCQYIENADDYVSVTTTTIHVTTMKEPDSGELRFAIDGLVGRLKEDSGHTIISTSIED